MDVNFSRAASAYKNSTNMLEDLSGIKDDINDIGKQKGGSFSDMMGDVLTKAIDNQYSTETTKLSAITGKTEITDLVTAVSQAELTLNTVVAVRDRVISAYQDILRMPI